MTTLANYSRVSRDTITLRTRINFTQLIYSLAVASLHINYGYARTAIRELSVTKKGSGRKNIDTLKRGTDFKGLFLLKNLSFQMKCSLVTQMDALALTTWANALSMHLPRNGILQANVLNSHIHTFSISKWNEKH